MAQGAIQVHFGFIALLHSPRQTSDTSTETSGSVFPHQHEEGRMNQAQGGLAPQKCSFFPHRNIPYINKFLTI